MIMRTSIWVDLVKLVGVFVLLGVAFVFAKSYWPEEWTWDVDVNTDLLSISVEQEEQLGEYIMDAFLEGQVLVQDSTVDSAIWAIKSRLLQQIDSTPYEYHFYVVDNEMVNAVTFPGGNIVVFTGLLKFCTTPEEAAAVIAHEIGHVEQRHVVDKLVTELGLSFVIAVVTGGDATLIHELSRTALSSVFSRGQESEADDFGMKLLEESSIDPRSLATFFRKMNSENMDYNEYFEWIMSHPHNNSRIKASLEYKVSKDFKAVPLGIDWERLKGRL